MTNESAYELYNAKVQDLGRKIQDNETFPLSFHSYQDFAKYK